MEEAVKSYHLSKRGAHNFLYANDWAPIEQALSRPWTPEDPDGTYEEPRALPAEPMLTLVQSDARPRRE